MNAFEMDGIIEGNPLYHEIITPSKCKVGLIYDPILWILTSASQWSLFTMLKVSTDLEREGRER